MKGYELFPLEKEAINELAELYRTTKDVRVRTRVQMILLSGEQGLRTGQIATIVRQNDDTVRTWLKRYQTEGINGLQDNPRSGHPGKVTAEYQEQLLASVRRRPRSLDQPYSLWTLERLADYMAEQTGLRVSPDTVRRRLKAADIVLSRPQHKISSPDPEYEVKKKRSKKPETT
jgi:transposase